MAHYSAIKETAIQTLIDADTFVKTASTKDNAIFTSFSNYSAEIFLSAVGFRLTERTWGS
jgi:hypothetical protein